jgi:hypothetical protein
LVWSFRSSWTVAPIASLQLAAFPDRSLNHRCQMPLRAMPLSVRCRQKLTFMGCLLLRPKQTFHNNGSPKFSRAGDDAPSRAMAAASGCAPARDQLAHSPPEWPTSRRAKEMPDAETGGRPWDGVGSPPQAVRSIHALHRGVNLPSRVRERWPELARHCGYLRTGLSLPELWRCPLPP